MIRLGILGSTRGSSLLPIIDAIAAQQLDAQINVIISNKADALILQKAAQHQLPFQFINPAQLTREDYDRKVTSALQQHEVDYVILIGYLRILSAEFVSTWHNKVLNVHPSLLPDFAGGMDLDVHRAVLDAGVKETGCTVHIVTEEVDAGPIVVQKKCLVERDDTPESLKARVQALEGTALIEAVQLLSNNHTHQSHQN